MVCIHFLNMECLLSSFSLASNLEVFAKCKEFLEIRELVFKDSKIISEQLLTYKGLWNKDSFVRTVCMPTIFQS